MIAALALIYINFTPTGDVKIARFSMPVSQN